LRTRRSGLCRAEIAGDALAEDGGIATGLQKWIYFPEAAAGSTATRS
jgi:hypothetical protein